MDKVTEVPKYGMKRKLDHEYPEKWSQDFLPSLGHVLKILPLIIRYLWYYIKIWWQGRKVLMDFIHPLSGKQIYGVPMGGLGCGTIGRGYKGEFCRYQITPGIYEYNTVDANQFIVTIRNQNGSTTFQSLLSTFKRNTKHLSAWESLIDGSKCQYTGLYPRSWTEYDLSEHGIKLVCRQVSPVIPNNYKDASLPTSMFIWQVENVTDCDLTVTITLALKNGTGDHANDSQSICTTKPFTYLAKYDGIVLHNTIGGTSTSYVVSTRQSAAIASVTRRLRIDPLGDGRVAWNQLLENGRFDGSDESQSSSSSGCFVGETACALAVQAVVNARSRERVEFNLVWDAPIVQFGAKNGRKRKRVKYYAKFFGADNGALKIVDYAFAHYEQWERAIYEWQRPVLDDASLPEWYKSTLFNETYYVSDGGSLWFLPDEEETSRYADGDPRSTYGRFAYLEGHEYRMYNTYDVHFYASFALALNWPQLQACVQYDLRDSVYVAITEKVTALYDGSRVERKVKGTVPHDLGDPSEDPFDLINAYPVHDVSEWRDLNTKFVLQVFRDYRLFGDDDVDRARYVKDMYATCDAVMKRSLLFDVDGDGLIENTGSPDQTYDVWVMTGSSAYCGSLWLAALYAMTVMSELVASAADRRYYSDLLRRAKRSFDAKLWNGTFYSFDVTKPDTIMTDQLCGHWYLRTSNVDDYPIVEKEKVISSLRAIYERNVMRFRDGNRGAVNGYLYGKDAIDRTTVQSEEVWIGVTCGLVSLMIYEGMREEGLQTIEGLYRTLTDVAGMAYETPEAVYEKNCYRSIGYMRPLAIWATYLALKGDKLKLTKED